MLHSNNSIGWWCYGTNTQRKTKTKSIWHVTKNLLDQLLVRIVCWTIIFNLCTKYDRIVSCANQNDQLLNFAFLILLSQLETAEMFQCNFVVLVSHFSECIFSERLLLINRVVDSTVTTDKIFISMVIASFDQLNR